VGEVAQTTETAAALLAHAWCATFARQHSLGELVEITMNVKLLVVHGRPQGKCLLFPRGEFVFGRGAECHIRPNSDWVSRQHCLLRVTGEALYIRDLGSRNGTLVNGARVVGERRLLHGDQIQVGPLVFAVQLEEAEPSAAQTAPPPNSQDTGTHPHDTGEMLVYQDGGPPSSDKTTEPNIPAFSALTVTPAPATEANPKPSAGPLARPAVP
jgi:predicted component of type VI protein secretion system